MIQLKDKFLPDQIILEQGEVFEVLPGEPEDWRNVETLDPVQTTKCRDSIEVARSVLDSHPPDVQLTARDILLQARERNLPAFQNLLKQYSEDQHDEEKLISKFQNNMRGYGKTTDILQMTKGTEGNTNLYSLSKKYRSRRKEKQSQNNRNEEESDSSFSENEGGVEFDVDANTKAEREKSKSPSPEGELIESSEVDDNAEFKPKTRDPSGHSPPSDRVLRSNPKQPTKEKRKEHPRQAKERPRKKKKLVEMPNDFELVKGKTTTMILKEKEVEIIQPIIPTESLKRHQQSFYIKATSLAYIKFNFNLYTQLQQSLELAPGKKFYSVDTEPICHFFESMKFETSKLMGEHIKFKTLINKWKKDPNFPKINIWFHYNGKRKNLKQQQQLVVVKSLEGGANNQTDDMGDMNGDWENVGRSNFVKENNNKKSWKRIVGTPLFIQFFPIIGEKIAEDVKLIYYSASVPPVPDLINVRVNKSIQKHYSQVFE